MVVPSWQHREGPYKPRAGAWDSYGAEGSMEEAHARGGGTVVGCGPRLLLLAVVILIPERSPASPPCT